MRQALRLSVIPVMLGVALYFVVRSWHWALLSDSATLHYVVFLMHHGFKPYREITDNNFPASYMAEARPCGSSATETLPAGCTISFCSH